MNYAPPGYYVWDTWYLPHEGLVHAYHLQNRRPANTAPDAERIANSLGHAVSHNLVDWEAAAPLLAPDPGNPLDDLQAWTGSALWHEGQGHLFYTMRGSASGGVRQHIGKATSQDLHHWERHPANPILAPDPRWYATAERPVPGYLDCRDLHVIPAPGPERGWYGFFATRSAGAPGDELPETSVIGCAWSADLLHWEQRPPAFAPRKYACIEAQDVFPLNGLWYMMCLAGNHYGNRGVFTDSNLVNGTIYAVAERPEGPYQELADNVLLAARSCGPISCRSVRYQGETFLLYSDRERSDRTDTGHIWCFGSIATPKYLRQRGERLVAEYCPLIEEKVLAEAFNLAAGSHLPPVSGPPWGQIWPMPLPAGAWEQRDFTIRAVARTGWSVRELDFIGDRFIFEAELELDHGIGAGLALRMDEPMQGAIVAIDAVEQVVFYAEAPDFEFMERRQAAIRPGIRYHLRVVQRLEHVEIYLDNILLLAFARYRGQRGGLGLFVDRAAATFHQVRLRTLDVTHPQ